MTLAAFFIPEWCDARRDTHDANRIIQDGQILAPTTLFLLKLHLVIIKQKRIFGAVVALNLHLRIQLFG